MRKHTIIAPHADDEIIGCFEILRLGDVLKVVFPIYNQAALKEAEKSSKLFGFETDVFQSFEALATLAVNAQQVGGLIFLPDPVYEHHPDHRKWGGVGRQLGKNVIYYTTNMNAPYMYECKHTEQKKEALDACYPKKSDLWRYDHKYFLFEGYTTWNIAGLL